MKLLEIFTSNLIIMKDQTGFKFENPGFIFSHLTPSYTQLTGPTTSPVSLDTDV